VITITKREVERYLDPDTRMRPAFGWFAERIPERLLPHEPLKRKNL